MTFFSLFFSQSDEDDPDVDSDFDDGNFSVSDGSNRSSRPKKKPKSAKKKKKGWHGNITRIVCCDRNASVRCKKTQQLKVMFCL